MWGEHDRGAAYSTTIGCWFDGEAGDVETKVGTDGEDHTDRARLPAERYAHRGELPDRNRRTPGTRCGTGASANPVSVAGPLHARPDERCALLRPTRADRPAHGRRDRVPGTRIGRSCAGGR